MDGPAKIAALREMHMVGPNGTDPNSWEYQASSILSVDMEDSGPMWHFQAACRHFSDGELLYVDRWPEEMDDFYGRQVRRCIPRFKAAYGEGYLKVDKTRFSLHARLYLNETEKAWLQASDMIHSSSGIIIPS